ncbi:hypothetical protein NCC49_005278 [Naganishia albida]|nr:hypothetical protein NCC49_005278 [Naganishia albida]
MFVNLTLLLFVLALCRTSSAQIPAAPVLPGYKLPDPNPWTDFCHTIGYAETADCGNFMYPGDRRSPNLFATTKAVEKCVAEIDEKSAEAAALYRFFGTDPGDMAKYAIGPWRPELKSNRDPKDTELFWDEKRNAYVQREYTPEDRQKAKERVEKRHEFYKGALTTSLQLGSIVVAGKATDKGVAIGASVFGQYVDKLVNWFLSTEDIAKEAYNRPWWEGIEPSGTSVPGENLGTRKDGSTFEITPEIGDEPTKEGPKSDSLTTGTDGGPDADSSDSSTASSVGDDEGLDPVLTDTPDIPDDENIARPMLDFDAKTQLTSCIEKASRDILKAIGTTDIAAWYDMPKSEADLREEAERNLRFGLCDRAYWGEEYCRKWKFERDTEEIPPDMLAEMQERKKKHLEDQARGVNCDVAPRPGQETLCHRVQQEIFKRYVVDDFTDKMVKSAFTPGKTTNRPTFNVDDFRDQVSSFKREHPNLPKLARNPVTGTAFKPSKPIDVPPSTSPVLSDDTASHHITPGPNEEKLNKIRQLLQAGKFGVPEKPEGWNDDSIPWKILPTGPKTRVSDAELEKFIRATKKLAPVKKPAGMTEEQWQSIQAAWEAAAVLQGASHDEL